MKEQEKADELYQEMLSRISSFGFKSNSLALTLAKITVNEILSISTKRGMYLSNDALQYYKDVKQILDDKVI